MPSKTNEPKRWTLSWQRDFGTTIEGPGIGREPVEVMPVSEHKGRVDVDCASWQDGYATGVAENGYYADMSAHMRAACKILAPLVAEGSDLHTARLPRRRSSRRFSCSITHTRRERDAKR